MISRIFGQENEIGFSKPGSVLEMSVPLFLSLLQKTDLKPLVMKEYSEAGFRGTYWLRNGAKLYKDTGEHPEYATPECSSVKDLVAHDKASEEIFRKLWRLAQESDLKKVGIVKNNTSYTFTGNGTPAKGFSWGLHESYLISANFKTPFLAGLAEQLLPHLMARVIYIGSGHIQPDTYRWTYLLSSRLDYVNTLMSNASTGYTKPFVLDRSEPHVDHLRWNRMQIISSEANMLELPIYLKYMTTHLCLRLIEDGWRLPDGFNFKEKLGVIHALNRDIYCTLDLPMDCGIKKTAIEVERFYLKEAKTLQPLSDEERYGLEVWEWVLDLLSQDLTREDNFVKLFGVLDWATKWYLIKQRMAKKNWPLKHPKILALNITYHLLTGSPKESMWQYLLMRDKEKPFMFRVVSESDIARAVYEAPMTRAKIRSDFIKLFGDFSERTTIFNCDWENAGYTIKCPGRKNPLAGEIFFGADDPFAVSSKALENLRRILVTNASE